MKPKLIRIMIPVEDEEKWASQYYRCYSMTRGLICKGDGEKCRRSVDTKTGALANRETKEAQLKEMECKGRECLDYGKQCKEVMNLQFLIPEVPGLGIWQVDTGSVNSIININSATELIRSIYGRVSMIPLQLTLEPIEVISPTDQKKKTVNILNIRSDQTLMALMETTMKSTVVMLQQGKEISLPESDDEPPELIIPSEQEPQTEEQGPPEAGEDDWVGLLAYAAELRYMIPDVCKLMGTTSITAWREAGGTLEQAYQLINAANKARAGQDAAMWSEGSSSGKPVAPGEVPEPATPGDASFEALKSGTVSPERLELLRVLLKGSFRRQDAKGAVTWLSTQAGRDIAHISQLSPEEVERFIDMQEGIRDRKAQALETR